MQPTTTASKPSPKRILSQRAIEANRRNAQQSTGPKTEAGKAKSRLNAGRHHITAQVTLLPDEERLASEAFCVKLAATFNPEGLEEIQLARGIAEAYWRLNQARAAITNRFALSLATNPLNPVAGGHPQIEYAIEIADTFARDAYTLRLISLYEQRTLNLLQRQKREPEAMQKAREQKREQALSEAESLYQYAAAQGEPWSPEAEAKANGGFLFSPALLEAASARRTRLHSVPNRKCSAEFASSAPRAA